MPGFPIRKSPDRISFADPRCLSQLITSFIASESQGIPRVLFVTFFYSCAFCAAWYAFFALVMMSHPRFASGEHKHNSRLLLFALLFYLLPICQRTFSRWRVEA